MSAQALAQPCVESSPVLALLPVSKRVRFEKYWKEYSALPRWQDPERLRLQADLAAGLMLPNNSDLHPTTALAVAAGLLQYEMLLSEGLAEAFTAVSKLHLTEPLPPLLGAYVTYALKELSRQFQSLGASLTDDFEASRRG